MTEPDTEISAWLRDGGWVVAASERAARAVTAAYHRARRAEGLKAWQAPAIFDWQRFVRTAWEEQANEDGRLVLDALQEQSVWSGIAGSDEHLATQLEGPLYRLASLAMEAHRLICSYAPKYLRVAERGLWQQDAGNFSGWLARFEETCSSGEFISSARLPLELIEKFKVSTAEEARAKRPALLLAGFDRILPVQRRVLDAWGEWQQTPAAMAAREVHFYEAPDPRSELIACALWCNERLAANPQARLLVITQEIGKRRGEFERAFLEFASSEGRTPGSSPLIEFSLGIPLSQVALARGAQLVLRLLTDTIEEHELDWLLSTGQLAAEPNEAIALQTYMRSLRRRGLERPHWSLGAFLSQTSGMVLPPEWVSRVLTAQRRMAEQIRLDRSPFEWAEVVPQILQSAGWPGAARGGGLSSGEFQAIRRWQQTLESCAALGFDGQRVSWTTFLSALARALNETVFAPESRDAPIQISGPAEAAGLRADAIWFMGTSEDAWPASGTLHPLLPPEVQRDAGMPHASAQQDQDLARVVTERLLVSAPLVCFSYARQNNDGETRPSGLIAKIAGLPEPLPGELNAPASATSIAQIVEDVAVTPFAAAKVEGGSSVLTHQSQCPFKAFATTRLGAQSWRPAQAGLNAAQRGKLLHDVLHSLWGGAESQGIRTLGELRALSDRKAFVAGHVSRAIQRLPRGVRERMPRQYLELEEQRLLRLVGDWLDYEAARFEFEVLETEAERMVEIAGLTFDLRLDRIDRLNDGTLLVIDYKTGTVTTKDWELPRPNDVQLPLYASFGLRGDETLGGLVFASVRRGSPNQKGFAGHVGDARSTLFQGLSGTKSMVKQSLTGEMIIDWRNKIESLARDFLAGRAEVDPREFPRTCERCGLETVCRIPEMRRALDEVDDESDSEPEAGDE